MLGPAGVQVLPLLLAALRYDVRKGTHSVGAHVRDAACYVCWAFARAYDPVVVRPHMLGLARGMLAAACFDREVNCRRAASAAFQENVGRQGHLNFPHGIDIVTVADFFALGNRAHAFTVVGVAIAAYEEYRGALLRHLVDVVLVHWDAVMRRLGACAIGRIAPLDPGSTFSYLFAALLPRTTSEEPFVRHGATLAVAELVLAAAGTSPPVALDEETRTLLRNVVPKVEKERLYRGRAGELVRAACCRLIEALALATHPLSSKAALRLLDSVDESICKPVAAVQAAAAAALRALSAHAMATVTEAALDRMPRLYARKLRSPSENAAVRRGMAAALGALPRSLLLASLDTVVDALVAATVPEASADARDAETRVAATRSLAAVLVTCGVAAHGGGGVPAAVFRTIVRALLAATADYCTDSRGDVGSWVREAGARALERAVAVAIRAPRAALEAQAAAGVPFGSPLGGGAGAAAPAGVAAGGDDGGAIPPLDMRPRLTAAAVAAVTGVGEGGADAGAPGAACPAGLVTTELATDVVRAHCSLARSRDVTPPSSLSPRPRCAGARPAASCVGEAGRNACRRRGHARAHARRELRPPERPARRAAAEHPPGARSGGWRRRGRGSARGAGCGGRRGGRGRRGRGRGCGRGGRGGGGHGRGAGRRGRRELGVCGGSVSAAHRAAQLR